MSSNTSLAHFCIVAKDWERLSRFYIEVFEFKPAGPKRDLSGECIDRFEGIKGVRIKGIHLFFPGCDDGPTLEILEFCPEIDRDAPQPINMHGFRHLAFNVDNVKEVLNKLLRHNGGVVGEIIQRKDERGLLTAVFASDPEGNIIEIMNWEKI